MSLDVISRSLITVLAAVALTSTAAAQSCPEHLQFLETKCAQWQSHVLPKSLPAARGNAFADNEAAAALGMRVFYDNRFSQSGSGVACVSCHDPEHAFAERKPTSHTIGEVGRNAPDLLDAAWYTSAHFWDGKVDNLWSAPLFTFEQADEMGSSRLAVVHTLAAIYKMRYEKVFDPLPDLSDTARFPMTGKPGTPQYDAMSEHDKAIVNQIYANLGKALEAYLRKVAAGRSRFDDFMNGSPQAIGVDAQHGMLAFSKNGCDNCHTGPTFTDEKFHDLAMPDKAYKSKDLAPARARGLQFARNWEFTATSKFADPAGGNSPAAAVTPTSLDANGDLNGFRTASLRNVDLTFPYGHDGAFETLEQAIDAHTRILPKHTPVSAQDKHDIIEFLRTLSGRPPLPPWNYWPGG